jgi:hypothetical protein
LLSGAVGSCSHRRRGHRPVHLQPLVLYPRKKRREIGQGGAGPVGEEEHNMNDGPFLSPNYRQDQVDLTKLADRILVYEDQIRGWYLEPAKALLLVPNSAFAVLHILMGYFEHHAIYLKGVSSTDRSKEFFRIGFISVFPRANHSDPPGIDAKAVSKWLADVMYSDARCGLFHEWMVRGWIAVTDKLELIRAFGRPGHITGVVINVDKFFAMIETHFTRYVDDLKNPNNAALRAAFNAGWETRNVAQARRAKKSKKKR